ncbi:MAG: hypothetical protein H6742_09135 [Alphaproteobacteria bacterium]|nr:hypothetical protein [Alphaproteobacteria bacterium]
MSPAPRFPLLSVGPLALASVGLLAACGKAPPDANPEFNDALVYAFRSFEGDEVDLAFAVRQLEAQVYLGMDVEAKQANDRALTPDSLVWEDVEGIEREERDPSLCLPVAVAGVSAHAIPDHAWLQTLADQTPVEPYSPDVYDRTFLEGGDCWEGRDCDFMRTHNDLVKDNILLTVPYVLMKDFRWVDLALPDPAEVEDGETVESDDPRWAIVARSWMPEAGYGEGGDNIIWQSFSLEIWIPRDGNGYLHGQGDDQPAGDWTADSTGGGVLRMMSLWSESELGGLNFDDDTIAATTRSGIDKNFEEAEKYLDEH